MNNNEIIICVECESEFLKSTSKMAELCPECAHILYGYPNCEHEFNDGKCIYCLWRACKVISVNSFL